VFPWINYVLVDLLFRFRFTDFQQLIMGEILVWLISLVNWLGTSLHVEAVERVSCQSVGEEASIWNSVAAHSYPATIISAELDNTKHPHDVDLVRGLRLGGSLDVLGSSLFPELKV
jgi:hypothetical protein